MNANEAKQLLAQIATFDRRMPSEAEAKHWATALRDVTLDDATAAYTEWCNLPGTQRAMFVMPGDLRAVITSRRNTEADRRRDQQIRDQLGVRPLDPEQIANLLAHVAATRQVMPHRHPISRAAYLAELELTKPVGCPWCGARPYERCTVPATGEPLEHRAAHPVRSLRAADRH